MNEQSKKAVSLRYRQDTDHAPIVSASGKGHIAEEILKIAEEHQIPIVEDPTLVELLAELNVNEHIPEDLYQVVAEVFAFIYQTDREFINKK